MKSSSMFEFLVTMNLHILGMVNYKLLYIVLVRFKIM